MSNTAFIYNELLNIARDLEKTITAVEDYPPYYYDPNNEQLAHDLNTAVKTIDNARRHIATASALGETTEPINNFDVNLYGRNGGRLFDDTQTDELKFYYMDGIRTEQIQKAIDDIHPNETTYYITDPNNIIVWSGYTATAAQMALNAFGSEYKLNAGTQTAYYNNLIIDFDEIKNNVIDYQITGTPNDIYGNMDNFLYELQTAVDTFRAADTETQLNGVTTGRITIKLR